MNKPPFALVALGKNWEVPVPQDPAKIQPSFDTRLTAEAAGILFTQPGSTFDRIIFSSGFTAGSDYPSEASAMNKVMREFFDEKQIPADSIILEEESFDTAGNLLAVNELCREQGVGRVALLTVGYHMPRTIKLARRLLDVDFVATYNSDEIVRAQHCLPHNFYFQHVVNETRERKSITPITRALAQYGLEFAARGLGYIDPSGQGVSQRATRLLRNQA